MGALAGVDSLMGYHGERPFGIKHVNLDPVSSLFGALCVLMALHHRQETGQGQYVDLSEQEVGIQFAGEAFMEYELTGRVPGPMGNRHPAMCPHNNYPCKGVDRWVSIAVRTEEEWRALCAAMGDPEWTREPRFADMAGRLGNIDEVDRLMAQWTIEQDASEVFHRLQAAGVAAAPCYSIEGVFFDPHFQHRRIYEEVEHPKTGTEMLFRTPIHLSETPGRIWRHAPLLGMDNEYVLEGILGMDRPAIRSLEEAQVVY